MSPCRSAYRFQVGASRSRSLAAAIVAWRVYARPPIDLTSRQRAVLTVLRLCAFLVVLFLLLRPLLTGAPLRPATA